ncbi:RNA polymerase sigma factor sigA-like isoform X1 [Magnolia sinica]|uniref:RNA polymerase sigma factor sigA-like isoform X1 n=1 Tax=Magnolia sinica TaxID=86752 RepID=UPI00265A7AC8|nr:RNA polymerase sigma factor sigA-like isoform X1 [Magnolia sinica]XP_058084697.1 RNA polymerase sigma factor sigA-like isoform X1 [Magnolia sinica]XP_058084698.1 RNA polymerase sigma factor sigA-like isoform X1 [Magnolia sinica]XP_058084699.1 RNA polymerase sigma factor sigA-like isoform X1 [Magnolia sinica]
MMATAAVIGLSAGKRLLSSSFYSSDLNDKLFSVHELGVTQFQAASAKNVIIAKKSNNFGPGVPSNRHTQTIKALKEHVDTSSVPSTDESWQQWTDLLEKDGNHNESSLEVLILLQKSMLEKQWNISFDQAGTLDAPGGVNKKIQITGSGTSARQRRTNSRRKAINQTASLMLPSRRKHPRSIISPELLQGRLTGYVKGISSKDLLSHAEVIHLSNTIKAGISLEEHKSKLQERLGCEPSDEQLVSSLRMSRAELHSKMIECSLARERLAMNNVRLVMSIAQKYDNMGAELADLVQGGLIGLLRGIEKFDSSKGYKISTYVYWWIRQGVSKALVENSRTLRLPSHLHERLSLIRNAKIRLEEKGITPSIDKIAESLKMSQKKVRNATEAISKVFSLDREAFPTLNGLPGETLHSYIADNNLENNPWHGFDEWSLKDEVNKLISTTLGERERDIIRLYYGLDKESHTWEDISRQFGLSRERVRQVGLVALEKLKHAARRRRLEAMLVKH